MVEISLIIRLLKLRQDIQRKKMFLFSNHVVLNSEVICKDILKYYIAVSCNREDNFKGE